MNSKDIKSFLKEARVQIKNKNYAQAMKTCKNILRLERENYMALIFLGKSFQEVGPKEQAIHAYQKAININPEQTLAWHGLASYYEKANETETDNKKELQNVYKKLIPIETDIIKLNELIEKYVKNAVYLQDITEPANVLRDLSAKETISDQDKRTVMLALASLFMQTKDIPTELLSLYETTLASILKEPSSISNDHYKEYLKTLYKLKKYETLFDEAINMFNFYTESTYPLEWICKVYVELAIEEEALSTKLEPQVKIYFPKLLKLQPDSVMALFVEAVLAYHEKQISSATDLLKKVVELRTSLVHAWMLLCQCFLHFCDYEEALKAITRADNILQVISREKLKTKLNRIQIGALAKHPDSSKNLLALELAEKLEDNLDEPVLESVIYANINLKDFEKANQLISKMKDFNGAKSIFLEAKKLHAQGSLKEALSLLKSCETEAHEVHLEIGKLYWEIGDYQNSLVPFLKAAKLNSDSFECFVCLAQFYEEIKDLEKARRCYQKAHKLNPRNAKAGIGLSNIYRQLKNWDANLALLHTITGGSATLGAKSESFRWAWLQLGLHHLHTGEYDLSVEWLRKLVRAEPCAAHFWECLADAYLARGSFVSAIRSYERAAELSTDNLYSKLQVANVKLKIGHLVDARNEFEEILKGNKKYVPALKGLGEAYLQLGITTNQEQRLGSSQYFLQQALDNFTTALRERDDFSCLWKFTGDCCYITAMLPEKYSCMVVHPSLTDKSDDNGDFEIMGKEELFTLAARCYCKAITTCDSTNIMLWQDLAVCYFSHGVLDKALSVARYCVQEDSTKAVHWNILGAIYFRQNKLALAQHAFIKAVSFDQDNALSWSNLGALYHFLGDIKLANQAYAKAQRADPSHFAAWTGQALIAAFLGHNDEAMDLFRHSSQLGYGDISAINYGSAVCQAIIENSSAINSYEIKDMHALPTAWDLLSWYIERHDEDACGWNILGLISERLGLHRNALKAFEHTVSLTKAGKYRDLALVNYGRRLTAQGRFEGAINALNSISEANFSGGCGLALAQFKSGDYEQSYETYEASMQWLAESEQAQSHVLVALAAMAYMFQGPDSAKTLLFQSVQISPTSRFGLYATLALGLLHSDYNLAKLVLKELQAIKNEPDVIYHCAFLDTYTIFLQGDKKKSIRCLSRYIHNHPGEASLWLEFAVILLQSEDKNLFKSAAKCAHLAMSLGRNTKMDITKVLCIVSYACLLSKDLKEAIRSAQKAVHCYPHVSEGWVTLLAILNHSNQEVKKQWLNKKVWLENIFKFVKGRPLSEDIKTWLSTFTILC